MADQDKRYQDIPKEKFEMVQRDEKIYDKRFETKPIGYFKDAMIRFAKNKTNVIATIILFTLITFAVSVPILTTKNIDSQEINVRHLPPRWPLVERIGIFDGLTTRTDRVVDRSTIGSDRTAALGLPDHLGLPAGVNPDYILLDTLTNYAETCFDRRESCFGGVNVLSISNTAEPEEGEDTMIAVIRSRSFVFDDSTMLIFNPDTNPVLTINIDDMYTDDDTELRILLRVEDDDPDPAPYQVIETITEAGEYVIDIFDILDHEELFTSRIRVELESKSTDAYADLRAINLTHDNLVDETISLLEGEEQVIGGDGYEFTYDPQLNTYDPTTTIPPVVTVVVDSMDVTSNTELRLMMKTEDDAEYQYIRSIIDSGTHRINLNEYTDAFGSDAFDYSLKLMLVADDADAYADVSSITFNHHNMEIENDGYLLSRFQQLGPHTTFLRSGAERLLSSYRFDLYASAFGEWERRAFSAQEFYRITEDAYADVCERMDDPANPDGWQYSEGCPVIRVVAETPEEDIVRVPSRENPGEFDEFYYYHVILDYMIYMEYDEMPYFIFGTDGSGRDLFGLTWLGLRTSLLIGLVASGINITIGIIYGSISGYYGGKVDILMERFSEVVGRIPWLVTLSIFIALFGPGAFSLIMILIISGWIGVASVTRTQFYRYKGREYVLASRTLGAKDSRLIFRHILPNGIGTIITASVLMIPQVIFTESSLSYLGFGIGHGQSFRLFGLIELSGVSIGVLLSDGRTEMLSRPYLTLFPAIIISILMITFNMFGNALRDAFNPSLRGSQ